LSRADRVIAFCQSMKITAGKGAGRKLKLRPWQRKIIHRIYRNDKSRRRIVRTALISMARKNGKTQLAATLALCHLVGPEAEARGEVYSAASDRNQAARVFREMEAMILADPDLSARCNVQRFAKRIEVMSGDGEGSTYEALSSDARKAHSLSPSFVVADELAQWPNRELFDTLVTGTGAREEPLVVAISTQSSDPNSVMSELVHYGEQVIEGVVDDPSFAAFVYTVPPDADPWDESGWYDANPALDDFRSLDEMRKFAEQAQRIPAREPVFRNLYLNQQVDAAETFLPAGEWRACGGAVDAEALRGRACFGGLDKSSTTDLSALVLYFPEDDGQILAWFWVPGDRLDEREDRDRVPYRTWREQGFIEAPAGRAIDNYAIANRLAEITSAYDVQGLAFDRWRIEDLKKILADEGIDLPLVDWGQGFRSMAGAVDALETAVLDRRILHGGHPVLAWNISNAIVATDPAGNRKLDKARSRERIDGAVALVMAIGLHAREPAPDETAAVPRIIAL
jgi:phage terminase large subunit-like protein